MMFTNEGSKTVLGCKSLIPNLAFLIVISSSVLLSACSLAEAEGGEVGSTQESGTPSVTEKVETEADCLEQGGRWEVLGLSGLGCNLPSLDGGKACQDNRDCEGLCLADDESVMVDTPDGVKIPDHSRIDQVNAQGEEIKGVCSMWQSDFGCQAVVEGDKIVVICID
jgi:hypothetical protein